MYNPLTEIDPGLNWIYTRVKTCTGLFNNYKFNPSLQYRVKTYGCLSRLAEEHCCTTATVVMCFTMPDMNVLASCLRSRRHDATAGQDRTEQDRQTLQTQQLRN